MMSKILEWLLDTFSLQFSYWCLILSIFNVLWSEIKENYTLCVGRAYAIRQDNFGAADVCYAHKIKSTITSGLSLPFASLIAVFSPTFFGPPVICCSLSVAQFGQTSDQVKKRQKNRCLTSKHSNSALYTLIRLHKNFSIVFVSFLYIWNTWQNCKFSSLQLETVTKNLTQNLKQAHCKKSTILL